MIIGKKLLFLKNIFVYKYNKNQYFFIHLFPKSNVIGNFYVNFILIQIWHIKIHKKLLHS